MLIFRNLSLLGFEPQTSRFQARSEFVVKKFLKDVVANSLMFNW